MKVLKVLDEKYLKGLIAHKEELIHDYTVEVNMLKLVLNHGYKKVKDPNAS